ncbi:GNAT family N-acetyltransferase [Rhizobium sp. GN54]|uniref:GNAT family N-acetyltransferase n=1 Tax=Rhizobium sp. GN54 TaxID=2898150 RepID=UPI001E472999|nr:GNAT family N-acetyltransferase [Rhizobium sp. GN54]MCD2182961.1 GNAT family N-acetyltransferase [Rhizobium sp. GN54]
MNDDASKIRTLTPAETGMLLGWAAGEGWNPGIADAPAFHATDPAGFIGAFVDGAMVAGISAVAYGEDFGFIGLYICRPDCRGRGYGRLVWNAGMRRLEGRTIGLDGVPEQQANYTRMGFCSLYRTWRWSGRPGPVQATRWATTSGGNVRDIVPPQPELAPAIETFDRRFFPAPRPAFLARWLESPRIARVLVRDGIVRGYGVARRCGDGFKIGPLFAEDAQGASTLLSALTAECGDATIHLDVPETAEHFSGMLADGGLQRGFVTARMYRGTPPAVETSGVFAVTTLELG